MSHVQKDIKVKEHLHHSGSTSAHVGDLVLARVFGIKHDLELAGVGVVAARRVHPRRNAVSDAAELDGGRSSRPLA